MEFWDVGLLRESPISIRKQYDTRSVRPTYSSRCSGEGAWPPAWGISLQTDSVDPISPLSILSGSFPAEKPTDNEPYTRHTPLPSLASLSIYPTQYSFSGLPAVPSPWSSITVQTFKVHHGILSFPGCGLPVTGPKSCLCSRTAIPESRFRPTLQYFVPVRPIPP